MWQVGYNLNPSEEIVIILHFVHLSFKVSEFLLFSLREALRLQLTDVLPLGFVNLFLFAFCFSINYTAYEVTSLF